MLLESFLSKLDNVVEKGGRYEARCPAHEDRKNSLCASLSDDGKILVHCQAGCNTSDVVSAMGLKVADLFSTNGSGHANGKPKREIVATYDYRDEAGTLLYQSVRYEPKDFKQRKPKPGGGWDWSVKDVRRVLYRLPELMKADIDVWVFKLEGEKDCDEASKRNLIATTNVGGAGKWLESYSKQLAGRRVCVIPDNDGPGKKHAEKVAASLKEYAAEVKILELPGLPEKGDLSDWLDAGGTAEELVELADGAQKYDLSRRHDNLGGASQNANVVAGDQKPQIIIRTDEKVVIDESISSLSTLDEIYQRAGALSHIVHNAKPPSGLSRPGDAPRIVFLPTARLRELMATSAQWLRPAGEGELEPSHPPQWAVLGVEARGQWEGIPPIEAVAESPMLRADGTILEKPGYDPATGIFYAPRISFPDVMQSPNRDDVDWALGVLLETWRDFPFAKEQHRSACVAACLTPLARPAFQGPTPLDLVDANIRAAGKGLLVDTWSEICLGREVARMTVPRNDDEFRKRITSIALAAEPIVLIDNITGTLNSPSLDAALTSTSWNDRFLGRNEMTGPLPLNTIWYGTGNNVVLGGDTARRTLHIRLESPEEKPEERKGFQHPDLIRWVRKHRGELVTAALTILRGYFVAGCPDMNLTPWGSFEGWSRLIRHCVVWAGMPDPGETREELASQSDNEANLLRQLIAGWEEIDPEGDGMTISQAMKKLGHFPNDFDTLRSALLELPSAKGGKLPPARSVGMKFHHLRQRIVAGKYFEKQDVRMGALWKVVQTTDCGSSNTNGTRSHASRERKDF